MLLVAHRTPASPARCAELAAAGARVFEVDVQLRGGEVAVSHYLPLALAGRLQRDNWRLRWHTAAVRDPGLAAVDAVVPPGCRVLLDLKESAPGRLRDLVAALAGSLADPARYVVCGVAPAPLDQAREAGFRTWRTARDRRELAALLADGALPDEAVSIRHSLLDRPVVERLHAAVPLIVAWTVNDPRRAAALRELGVNGLTTDRVAVLRHFT